MNKVGQTPIKRKISDDASQSIVSKFAKTTSVADIQTKQSDVTGHTLLSIHTSRLFSHYSWERINLITNQSKRDIENIVVQDVSEKLTAEILERENEMMNLKETIDSFDQNLVNIEDELHFFDGCQNEIQNNYAPKVTSMIQRLTDIDEFHEKMSSDDLENQISFEREVELHNRKLNNVNEDIDFVLRQREECASQRCLIIEENGKLAIEFSQLQKALEEMNNQEQLIKYEKEANVKMSETLKKRIEQIKESMNENVNDSWKIIEAKKIVMAEQEDSNVTLTNVIEKNENLHNELKHLNAKTNKLEKQYGRIQQANHNIRDEEEEEESKLEFHQKYLSLLTDEKDIIAKVSLIEITVDKQKSQYNELKQIQSEIEEIEQHYAEIESNLIALKTNVLSRLDNIFAAKKTVNDIKIELAVRAKGALNLVKQSALATDYLDCDNASNISSTVSSDKIAFELESEMTDAIFNR